MFSSKYTLNKKSIITGAISLLEKIDSSGMEKGERLENICAKELMADKDVEFLVESLKVKFDIKTSAIIVPRFDDSTLLIKEYVFAVNKEIILTASDYRQMVTKLRTIMLNDKEEEVKAFADICSKAESVR